MKITFAQLQLLPHDLSGVSEEEGQDYYPQVFRQHKKNQKIAVPLSIPLSHLW